MKQNNKKQFRDTGHVKLIRRTRYLVQKHINIHTDQVLHNRFPHYKT